MKIIKRNAVKCNKCGDIIESTHRHDLKWCSCKTVAVDGGLEYIKRCSKSEGDYIELSETIYDDIKHIYCIQGFTSSGKDSITNRVSKELNIPILVSHTTRPPREGEENGKTYHFVDDKFFDENEFLEQKEYWLQLLLLSFSYSVFPFSSTNAINTVAMLPCGMLPMCFLIMEPCLRLA